MSLQVLTHGFLLWLLEPAVRAIAIASCAAAAVPLFRLTSPRSRLTAWTMVLYIALALPLVGPALPAVAVPLPSQAARAMPWLASVSMIEAQGSDPDRHLTGRAAGDRPGSKTLARNVATSRDDVRDDAAQTSASASSSASHASAGVDAASLTWSDEPLAIALARHVSAISWGAVGLGLYALIALVLLVRLPIGSVLSRRLDRVARAIDEAPVLERFGVRAAAAGLARAPALKESTRLTVPVTLGVLSPVVLLPSEWRRWDAGDLDAILVHELSHVARGDALTQQVALIYRAFFWFSPLAWWLNRHLVDLAEQASDEAALAAGADSTRYASTLVRFLKQVNAAPQRVRWQGVSMAKAGRAERRVDRILAWTGGKEMRKSYRLALIVVSAPLVIVLASVRPVTARAQSPAAPAPRTAASTVPDTAAQTPAPPAPRTPAAAPVPAAVIAAPPPEPAPVVAPPPPPPPAPPTPVIADHLFGNFSGDEGPRYVLMSGTGGDVFMSGTRVDLRHARALRSKINGDFIWFQQDEKSYVITDPATIARVKALFAPVEALGRQQEALGRQQQELGRQQQALAHQMEGVRVKLPDLTNELSQIQKQIDAMSTAGATQAELGRLQSAVGRLQSRIGSYQSDAGSRQGEIGRQQGELGRRQGELGRQQGELGREQARQSRIAHDKLRALLADAVSSGLAKPE